MLPSVSVDTFSYIHSCDFELSVGVKIAYLDGDVRNLIRHSCNASRVSSDVDPELFWECSLVSDGARTGDRQATSYRAFLAKYSWQQWLVLPTRFADVSRDAQLNFTLFALESGTANAVPIGSTRLSLFNTHGKCRQGAYDLLVAPQKNYSTAESEPDLNDVEAAEAFEAPVTHDEETGGKLRADSNSSGQNVHGLASGENDDPIGAFVRLRKQRRAFDNGFVPQIAWLDRHSMRTVELELERLRRISPPRRRVDTDATLRDGGKDLKLESLPESQVRAAGCRSLKEAVFLRVELARFADDEGRSCAVVYYDKDALDADESAAVAADPTKISLVDDHFANEPKAHVDAINNSSSPGFYDPASVDVSYRFLEFEWRTALDGSTGNTGGVDVFENPVEMKHRCLARARNDEQRDAKPSPGVAEKLNSLLACPPTVELTTDEQDMIWRWRHYLVASGQSRALILLLKSVRFDEVPPNGPSGNNAVAPAKSSGFPMQIATEKTVENEASEALRLARGWSPPPALDDALELLGRRFANVPTVRRFAVRLLSKTATDEQLVLFLPQLVQALRYDNVSRVIELLTARIALDSQLSHEAGSQLQLQQPAENEAESFEDLATFLIDRSVKSWPLLVSLYWYMKVEAEGYKDDQSNPGLIGDLPNEPSARAMLVKRMYALLLKLLDLNLMISNPQRRCDLKWQCRLVDDLLRIAQLLDESGGRADSRLVRLRELLEQGRINISGDQPVALPIDPRIRVVGVRAEAAYIFKSKLRPFRVVFKTAEEIDPAANAVALGANANTNSPPLPINEYSIMFKNGDDLRQDQLILQMIAIMDQLLKRDSLDLKLTVYKVMATSTTSGIVELVPSVAVADVIREYNSIDAFLRQHNPCPGAKESFEILPEVMDNYVRSCAGYCVITYILGVGDRHLNNLLLQRNGKLFHIDFGYILGREPKPFQPPMKLTREMVAAMVGPGTAAADSIHFQAFKQHCYTAFQHLRRHANLFLNLFALLVDSSIPEIASEPEKSVRKIQDKFHLELSEEQAVRHFESLIQQSINAVFGQFTEKLHELAVFALA